MSTLAKRFLAALFGILSSRVLGFLREIFTAYYFGASLLTDAFFLAWKIPNLFRRVLGEGALEKVFLPLLRGRETQRDFIRSVFGYLLGASLVLTDLLSLFSENVVSLIAADRGTEFIKIAALFLSALAFYLPFAVVNAYYTALLQFKGVFFWSYLSSALFNLVALLFLLLLHGSLGIEALLLGVLVGGLLQVLYISLLAKLKGVFFLPSFRWNGRLKTFFGSLIPSLASAGVGQIATVAEAFFATAVGFGILSCLYYAFRLFQLPVSLIGVASSRVALVHISRLKGHMSPSLKTLEFGLKRYLLKASEIALFFALPVVFSVLVYAKEVVALVYQRGAFGLEETQRVALYLQLYSLGLPAVVLYSNAANIYYSKGRFYTAFFLSLLWVLAEVLIPLTGIYILKTGGWIIALSHSLGAWGAFLALSLYSRSLGLFFRAFRRVLKFFPHWVANALFLEATKGFSFPFATPFAVALVSLYYLWLFKRNYLKGRG